MQPKNNITIICDFETKTEKGEFSRVMRRAFLNYMKLKIKFWLIDLVRDQQKIRYKTKIKADWE